MPEPSARSCGGCTACCKTHGIVELPKEPFVWCAFCEQGKGCSINATKPASCAAFRCLWHYGHGEEEDRPDKRGIIPDIYLDEDLNRPVVMLWEFDPGALERPYGVRLRDRFMKAGYPVMEIRKDLPKRIYFLPTHAPSQEALAEFRKAKVLIGLYLPR